ncbi:nucleotide-diphospho-sugar transferase [Melampsora americana]|nr:nucleotide-diphospho-sugar transferase [Melampsora americana]
MLSKKKVKMNPDYRIPSPSNQTSSSSSPLNPQQDIDLNPIYHSNHHHHHHPSNDQEPFLVSFKDSTSSQSNHHQSTTSSPKLTSFLLSSSSPEPSVHQLSLHPKTKWIKTRWILIILPISLSLYILYALLTSHHQINQSIQSFSRSSPPIELFKTDELPLTLTPPLTICDYCDCSVNSTSPPLWPINSGAPSSGSQSALSFKIWSSIRDIYCHHAYLAEGFAVDLLRQTDLSQSKQELRSIIQWNLLPLSSSVPTTYLFTKTSAAGKTKHLREAYFKRHILTIRTHLALTKNRVWPIEDRWGPLSHSRQLIWLIIEDSEKLSSDVANVLAKSGLPFVYLVYGPTHHFGNAQQNAAYGLIHRLSSNLFNGVFGHGPVISIDDDSNFLPELLEMIWKVKKIGVWPMGNLGPNGWEGPIYDSKNQTFLRWEAGAIEDRKYPIDNGAFCFHSNLFESMIHGPKYWPTDFSGGESEFIGLMVKSKEEIEPICYNCHVAWHNEPLPRECTDLQLCG